MEKIKVGIGEVGPVQTVEEFDALLGVYEKQNPAKFALKIANGDFEKQRSKLKGYVAPKVEVKPEEKKEEPKAESKPAKASK